MPRWLRPRSRPWGVAGTLGVERLELAEHGWDELRNGWVDVHRPLNDGVRRLRIHDVQNRMNYLVTTGAQDGGAQDLARLRVDDDLHEALRFTFLDGPADFGHRALADERTAAGLANFRFREAGPAKWWVDVQSIGNDAITHPARVVVEEIRRDNFGIVEGGVRK